jgi:hypothetical protein
LTVIPPSTLIFFTSFPESLTIAYTTSHVLKHGASNKDLAKCRFSVCEHIPIHNPLASSRQYGENMP